MDLDDVLKKIENEQVERTGTLDLSKSELILIPKEVLKLTHITQLDLSFNDISDICIIEKLPNLTRINLAYNQVKDLSFLEKLTELTALDISENLISDLAPLKNLTSLIELGISHNRAGKIECLELLEGLINLQRLELIEAGIVNIDFIKHLVNLKHLDLSFNDITDLTPLKGLFKLDRLDLYGSDVTNLCPLAELTNLTFLDLTLEHPNNNDVNVNQLRNLINLENLSLRGLSISSLEFISGFTNLSFLKLALGSVREFTIPETLINLVEIGLRHSDIANLTSLDKLPNLRTLDVSYCKSNSLNFLARVTNLRDLDLSGIQLTDLAPLKGLTNLTKLNLSGNRISDIGILKKFTDLTFLSLSDNKISNISHLKNITGIVSLDLKNNQISDVTHLENLTKLIRLDLSSNNITNILPLSDLIKGGIKVASKSQETGLFLEKNPLITPPSVIVDKGSKAILEWLEQLEGGGQALFESKIMLLGQGSAGKTTLTNLLIDHDYEVLEGKEDSTLGIKIHKNIEFSHYTKCDTKIKGHLWDFGGQDIQKMLHQFFITENCLYILVHDKRKENTNFDYWFQIINLLGPNSSVIVLENPKDMESNNYDFPITSYRELFPNLRILTCEVNLKHTRGKYKNQWTSFLDHIRKELSNLEIVNRPVPQKWALLRDELNKSSEKYISKDDFYNLCSKSNIALPKSHAELCLFYLKSLGELVHYEENNLCNRIYLDHNWLTKGLYYILSDKEIKLNGGRFTRNQAYNSWEKYNYNEDEKQMLLNLLLKSKFDICYRVRDSDTFITPILLPSDKPKPWELKTNLHFRFQYTFMPHGMFSRLIVRVHEKIDSDMKWESGVRLTNENATVLGEVQQTLNKTSGQKIIDVRISGDKEGSKELLSFVRREINSIHNDFNNLQFEEFVACNCQACEEKVLNNMEPSFFEYDKLRQKIKKGKYFEECKNAGFEDINIGSILSDMVLEKAGDENLDNELLQILKGVGMSINNISQTNNNQQSIENSGNSAATANSTASAEAKNNISIEIKTIIGETESLLEDIEDERKFLEREIDQDVIDLTIRDVEKAKTAIEEINLANESDNEPTSKSKNRLNRFITDLYNEESGIHKVLSSLRNGRDYGVGLAEGYNKVAENIGLPSVPPVALEILKKL